MCCFLLLRFVVTVFASLRNKVKRTLNDLYCLYFEKGEGTLPDTYSKLACLRLSTILNIST